MAGYNQDVAAFVEANLNNPQAIADAMTKHGFSTEQVAEAIGKPVSTVSQYFNNAGLTVSPSNTAGLYAPDGTRLNFSGGTTSPSYAPPVVQPTYAPPVVQPTYAPPVVQPTYAPPVVQPTYAPPVVQPKVSVPLDADIKAFFDQHKWNPQNVAAGMQQYGVDAAKLAAATGYTLPQINAYLSLNKGTTPTGGLSQVSGQTQQTGGQPTAVPITQPTAQQTGPSNDQIKSFFNQHVLNPSNISQGMQQFGVDANRLSQATGYSTDQINKYLGLINNQTGGQPQQPTGGQPQQPTGGLGQMRYDAGNTLDLNALRPSATNSVYNYHQGITNKLWGGQ